MQTQTMKNHLLCLIREAHTENQTIKKQNKTIIMGLLKRLVLQRDRSRRNCLIALFKIQMIGLLFFVDRNHFGFVFS